MHRNFTLFSQHCRLLLKVALLAGTGFLWLPGMGQAGAIWGTVVDGQVQQPLLSATVRVLGTEFGAQSNDRGIFKLEDVPAGNHRVCISYLGYLADTVDVAVKSGGTTTLNAYLKEKDLELEALQINSSQTGGLSLINRLDVQLRPVASSQELLRMVPGVFIAQHAGGGKAEQIFMRGFDVDHGTDLALTADGMPVNMVSHAHGQGYADLHFVIPETVERLGIDKGPYSAKQGNLATAGSIDFQTKNSLDENLVKLEGGMYNNYRALAMIKIGGKSTRADHADAYVAGEYLFNQGFFESLQNLHRVNVFAKYRKLISRSSLLTASVSDFRSQWNASGQIPDRAVAQGLISPFGSIDPTEGGQTSRSNLNLQMVSQMAQGWQLKQQAYLSHYDFNLFSNFTFFAHDSLHGDQIQQTERRWLYGYNAAMSKTTTLLGRRFQPEAGLGFRKDDVGNIGLYHSVAREFLNRVQQGKINETNGFAWVNGKWSLSRKLDLSLGLRSDVLHFAYLDRMEANTSMKQTQKAILSPKFNLDYFVNERLQLFVKAGSGFHSNDTRVVLGTNNYQILPRAVGADIGAMFKPVAGLLVQVAAWGLAMEQEFVYVGDEGVVEPSGKSRRVGLDVSARYQMFDWLAVDCDVNVAHARGIDGVGVASYIPLAPWITSTGGLTAQFTDAFKGSLRYRFLGNRAADETWDLTAQGYCILDAALSYTFKSRYVVGLSAANLLDSDWKEAQFATTTRLRNEPADVTEIHFTPGTPIALKLSLGVSF
jgi:outer membrane receptor protein involved in Fe transport